MKVVIFGNIIADILLFVEKFPIEAQDLQGVSHLDAGPGGACNVAIMAARFGLEVISLGEIGEDQFGRLILSGLQREGVDVSQVRMDPDLRTPVAGVLIDPGKEPAYLGFPGLLRMADLPDSWRATLAQAEALFIDGWTENDFSADLVLQAMRISRENGRIIFFDPGPGNPRRDNSWHREAVSLATVILANEQEIQRVTGLGDPVAAAQDLLNGGCKLIFLKQGSRGSTLYTPGEIIDIPGLPVQAVDQTGAGDSLAGAVIYAYLHGLPLGQLGALANATGAAMVQKIGTGHQVPTLAEIRAVLDRFGQLGGLQQF